MEGYRQMRKRQQAEIDAVPMKFAFSNQQLLDALNEWGFGIESLESEKAKRILNDEVISVTGGGLIRREDEERLVEICGRHSDEFWAAIDEDESGEGFVYEMFSVELENHEYGYTGDVSETLDALGLRGMLYIKDVRENLKHGLEMALRRYGKESWDGC